MHPWDEVDVVFWENSKKKVKKMNVDAVRFYIVHRSGSIKTPWGKLAAIWAGDTVWNEAYIMLVSCIDYALDMTCIQSVSQCFIVGGIL